MRVRRIVAGQFMRYQQVDLLLPATGVVLITGNNGAGKSSVAEVVSHAAWGASLRKELGWRLEESGGVEIELEIEGGPCVIRRQARVGRTGKTTFRLHWEYGDYSSADYPTRTKAQEGLEGYIGTFRSWSAACVFNGSLEQGLAHMTDANRKRFLEGVLNLVSLERAYKMALEERRGAQATLGELEHELELVQARLEGLSSQREQLQQTTESLGSAAELEGLRTRSRGLQDEVERAREAEAEANAQLEQLRARLSGQQAEQLAARQAVRRVTQLDAVCPMCEQPIDPAHQEELRATYNEECQGWSELVEQARGEVDAVMSKVQEARQVVSSKRQELAGMVAVGRRLAQEVEQRQKWETAQSALAEQEQVLTQQLGEVEGRVAESREELGLLDAACYVLGLRGVRAQVLGNALALLQNASNMWLGRLGLDRLSVECRMDGDAVLFAVHGAGGGRGYGACSTGEKRRIDVALTLALGDMVAAGAGLPQNSTLFMDELFDSLDEEGLGAAVALLEDLSSTRAVVVITHMPDLIDRLARAQRWHAEDGELKRLN
jgi:DNA repair exonuclease SbcCD ATPase subunit